MIKSLTLLACGLGLSTAHAATLASWDSFDSLTSKQGNLTLSVDKFTTSGVTHTNGQISMTTAGRTWVDISSLDMNLSKGSYSITLNVSNLTLSNGPIFSMTSGNYNSQNSAFGAAVDGGKWSFSNNGGSMNVKGEPCVFTANAYSGTLTVNFLTEKNAQGNNVNYVQAFLGSQEIVAKTQITYTAATSDLKGLTFGGWGSTTNFGSSFTMNSLSITRIDPVPEPTTATLGIFALASLLLRRRRA